MFYFLLFPFLLLLISVISLQFFFFFFEEIAVIPLEGLLSKIVFCE